MTRRLRVAVPSAVEAMNAMSGAGKMWRHVLERLARTSEIQSRTPVRARSFGRRVADVWLSDCGFGPLDVAEPVVVQVHEAGWDDDEVRATIDPDFLEVVLEGRVGGAVRAATRIITPSMSAKRQVIDHWGVPDEIVHAVPHGVDAAWFRPGLPGGAELVGRAGGQADRPYVLFVSQIHPRKNLPVLRDAMLDLHTSGYSHQLVIVGAQAQDRKDSNALDEEAGSDLPGTRGVVVRLRDVSEGDLAALISGAAAFCLPSLMEGFGMTLLEAMSCGVPCVVSDRGSLPEVAGDAAVVVPPTREAVRDGLASVLGDAQHAAALGQAARARAITFTWDRTAAGWREVLDLAARDKRRRLGRHRAS